MPRPKKLRAELETHGVMTNEYGVEVGRLTLNGILVLNLAEVYMEIERWAATHSGKCSYNHLCKEFSRSGSWGFDPAVHGAVIELLELNLLAEDTNATAVVPLKSSHAALKKIPAYVTRAEAHASLEELDE